MILSGTQVRDTKRRGGGGGGATGFPFPVDTLWHQQPSAFAVSYATRQRHHIIALIHQIKANTEYFNVFCIRGGV